MSADNNAPQVQQIPTRSGKTISVRPVTPAYPVIAKVFEKATKDIIAGADVQNALDAAVDEIDKNIADNNGYKSKK